MDKGLEKINILNEQLNDIIEKIEMVEGIIINHQDKLEKKLEEEHKLETINQIARSNKNKIRYFQKITKTAKRNMIVATLSSIVILESLCFLLVTNFLSINIQELVLLLSSSIIIPSSIMFGDVSHYRSKKRFLKEHDLEEQKQKIEKNTKQIELLKKEITSLKSKLEIFIFDKEKLVTKKENTEKEIKEISDIRKDIIDAYISDNKELETLLNSGYKIYLNEEEINKKFIK